MRKTESFPLPVPTEYDVPIPHECVPAFLDSLEEAGPDLGYVPMVVGVTRGDAGLSVYLERPAALSLRDFALVVSWQSTTRQ